MMQVSAIPALMMFCPAEAIQNYRDATNVSPSAAIQDIRSLRAGEVILLSPEHAERLDREFFIVKYDNPVMDALFKEADRMVKDRNIYGLGQVVIALKVLDSTQEW